jgi:lysophospholipase L1-like esterase
MIYNVLACLGDSLTSGARDPFLRNYPLELASVLCRKTSETWHCVTDAVNGRTSSELANVAYRFLHPYTDVYGALILIGTNDSRYRIPPEIFFDNLQQIVVACRLLRKKPYVLTIPMVEYQRHFLWYDARSAELIEEYNKLIMSMSDATVIDIRDVTTGDSLEDGVHFSRKGNVRVAEKIAASLFPHLPI